MKRFAKMGWIRQGFLGLIVCAVMSPSHAMSVRERYLLQHPQAASAQETLKPAKLAKTAKQTRKHSVVEKKTSIRQKTTNRRTTKIKQPLVEHKIVNHKKIVRNKAVTKNVERKAVRGKVERQKATIHRSKVVPAKVVKKSAVKRNLRPVNRKVARVASVKKTTRIQVSKKVVVKHARHTATKRHHRH